MREAEWPKILVRAPDPVALPGRCPGALVVEAGRRHAVAFAAGAADVTIARPDLDRETGTEDESSLEPGYLVIVWNDPVNLMVYVTHVFMKVFGWNKTKAEQHMLQVHEKGKSVVARESLEKAEFYVHQLHKYSLQATMEPDR